MIHSFISLRKVYMSKVTIQDIAERCGVATSTVSRVLNGSNLISGNRADEIRKIAKELGYQKRVIRRSASRTILNVMVVLPFHSERSVQLFYDYSELLNGIQCFVPTEKANILTTSRQTDLIQNQYKKGGGIDAVIFAFTQPRSDVTIALKQKGIPILVINREWKQGDFVTCDHKKGVETITHNAYEKIVNSNPCYLSLNSSPNVAALRMEGFIHALEKRGFIDPQERILTVEKVEEIEFWVMKPSFFLTFS